MDPKVQEALYILAEECAEVIQAVSKINRFGLGQINPVTNKSNVDHLENEIGDVLAMIHILHEKLKVISMDNVESYGNGKFEKLKKFSNLLK